MRKTRRKTDEPFTSSASDRLKFVMSGMVYTAESDAEINSALNWFYFALVLSMMDPMAAASLLLELEDQPSWTDEYRELTRDNAKLALEQTGRFVLAKEATA